MQASRGGDIAISATVRDKVLSEKASVLVRDVEQDEPMRLSVSIRTKGSAPCLPYPCNPTNGLSD